MVALKSIVHFLIDPLHLILLFIVTMGWFYYRGKLEYLKWTSLTAGLFFLLTATYPIPDLLIGNLEGRYEPLLEVGHLQRDSSLYILVLGSGHTVDPDLPPTDQLSSPAIKRLVEGLRLAEDLPESTLIVSGYAGTHSSVSQASVMASAARELGMPSERIAMQEDPSTTSEEAQAYVNKYGVSHSLILVTSASHMPRAVNIFGREGLTVIPAPTDYKIKIEAERGWRRNLFSHQNFYKVKLALHEYIGMLWERIRY